MDPRIVALLAVMATIIVVAYWAVRAQRTAIYDLRFRLKIAMVCLSQDETLHSQYLRRVEECRRSAQSPGFNPNVMLPETAIRGTGGPSGVVGTPAQ